MYREKEPKGISRRDFLNAGVTGVFAAFLKTTERTEQDRVLDLVPKNKVSHSAWPIDGPPLETVGNGIDPTEGYRHLQETVNVDENAQRYQLVPDGRHHIGVDFNLGDHEEDCGARTRLILDGVCIYVDEKEEIDLGSIAMFAHLLPDDRLVYSRYAHLSMISAIPGKNYLAGDIVGRIGKSGWELGNCHLHLDVADRNIFEWHYTGIWEDPRWYPDKIPLWFLERFYIDPVQLINSFPSWNERLTKDANLLRKWTILE